MIMWRYFILFNNNGTPMQFFRANQDGSEELMHLDFFHSDMGNINRFIEYTSEGLMREVTEDEFFNLSSH